MVLELHRLSVIHSLMPSTSLLSVRFLFPSGHGACCNNQKASLPACLPASLLEVLSGILTLWVFHGVSTRTLADAALQTRNSEALMTGAIQECRTGWGRGQYTAVPHRQKTAKAGSKLEKLAAEGGCWQQSKELTGGEGHVLLQQLHKPQVSSLLTSRSSHSYQMVQEHNCSKELQEGSTSQTYFMHCPLEKKCLNHFSLKFPQNSYFSDRKKKPAWATLDHKSVAPCDCL